MYYIIIDLNQDHVCSSIDEATAKCIKLGYKKFRDSVGGEYYI